MDAYYRAMAQDIDDDGAELARARIQSGQSVILREFEAAYKAGDEEAMGRAENKFKAYNSYIREGEDPDTALDYASRGPSDPDPEVEREERARLKREVATQYFVRPERRPERRPEPVEGPVEGLVEGLGSAGATRRSPGSAAAHIRAPKLTIPINNRSP